MQQSDLDHYSSFFMRKRMWMRWRSFRQQQLPVDYPSPLLLRRFRWRRRMRLLMDDDRAFSATWKSKGFLSLRKPIFSDRGAGRNVCPSFLFSFRVYCVLILICFRNRSPVVFLLQTFFIQFIYVISLYDQYGIHKTLLQFLYYKIWPILSFVQISFFSSFLSWSVI